MNSKPQVMTVDQFFEKHPYITAAGLSKKSGVSYQAIRLEIAGKYSDPKRIEYLEKAIHQMGKELQAVKLNQPANT